MPATPDLIQAARLALTDGDVQRAESLMRAALQADTDSIPALEGLARIAIERNDFAAAVMPLDRLHQLQPRDPQIAHHLAIARAQLGQFDQACDILSVLLAHAPNFLSARLHWGIYLQDVGKRNEACRQFAIALRQVREQGIKPNAPVELPYLLDHARKAVKQAQFQIYREAVVESRARHGTTALQRIDDCVDIFLKRREADYAHPKQRPATMYIPDLLPRPFFERAEFPWLDELEAATEIIREELLPLLNDDAGFVPYVQLPPDHPQAGAWSAINNSRNWSALHLYRHGRVIESNAVRCPRTMDLLAKLPLMHIRNHAPEVVVSVLRPQAHIPPHYGSVNGRLIVHLPLIVPANCGALAVAGEQRSWEEGRCLVFDDSFVHEAWNNSDQVRVVLLLDIWNPQLSEVERRAFASALGALDDFSVNVLGNPAMSFN